MKSWVDFQARVYQALPHAVRRAANVIRVWPDYQRWRASPDGQEHARRILGHLEGKYKGHRCIVIGNGPSLKRMDLDFLRDEYTFGLNRIYMMFDEWGFETDFLVAVNRFVMDQYGGELERFEGLKVFNWKHRKGFSVDSRTVFLPARPGFRMTGDVLGGYFLGGGTVTNVALELAFFLGFSEVILIGVDHSYREKGVPGQPVRSQKDDVDHFHPEYFGRGAVWQLPNYLAMEDGYRNAKRLFETEGRRVIDCTLDGKLEVFEKAEISAYLARSEYAPKHNYTEGG